MSDEPWRILIEAFSDGALDGPTFERRFLELRRGEIGRGVSQRFAVDLLFYEVDAFCADPALRDREDIDEAELRRQAMRCLAR
jgi:hypothetical protein